ncbi:MAG: oligosaccharide repeat unit polymerase [Spirochaetota bacterium]|nr:oligosaccharide repeat unit polymerase [Spirochaetota bacterium]
MQLKYVYNHPYKFIILFILIFFSFLSFQGMYFSHWGDAEIYLNISQVLFNNNTLYKDAVDTKHIGFLLFYYFLYFPYAFFFDTVQYFPILHGFSLSILYFGIGALSYKITNSLYDKKLSLLTSISILCVIFGNQHSLFINQPQVAILFVFIFLLYLHKTFIKQSYFNYFVYGVLLALAFTISHILIPLVLIIPFLVLQKDILINKNIFTAFYKCTIAALGFLCIISIFIIYLYSQNALNDWLYWNTIYPLTVYTKTTQFTMLNGLISFDSSNDILKMILIFLSFFGIGNNFKFPLSYSIVTHYFFIISCVVSFIIFIYRKYIIKQNFNLSSIEYTLMFFGFLSIISRFLISRVSGSDSYNIYLLPFIICYFPLFYQFFPLFKKVMSYGIVLVLFINLTYIPFRYFLYPSKITIPNYMKQLTILNPNKKPTVINYPWHTSLYSTQWKPLFYAHIVVDNYNFYEKVIHLQPEIFFYSSTQKIINPNNFLPFIEKNYQQVLENTYIRKDMVSSWNLPQ